MKNKKRTLLIVLILLAVGAAGYTYWYVFMQSHRDVQASKADLEISASALVKEYLEQPDAANEKYLSEDGESKILIVHGSVESIEENLAGNIVLLLQSEEQAGVSCTLISNPEQEVQIGQEVSIKGVIRAGASYDEDLDIYENVILEKSKIIL